MQLIYYTYLYGNLVLNDQPVSLFYRLEAQGKDRTVTLQPISLGAGALEITRVTLDGLEYTQFNGHSCAVTIPAEVGGEFRVTFVMK